MLFLSCSGAATRHTGFGRWQQFVPNSSLDADLTYWVQWNPNVTFVDERKTHSD